MPGPRHPGANEPACLSRERTLALAILLLIALSSATAQTIASPVAKVNAGHILVLEDGSLAALYGVECPSSRTLAGEKARDFTRAAVLGQPVTLNIAKLQSGVTFVRVTLPNGQDLAEQLLRNGLATLDDIMLDQDDPLRALALQLRDEQALNDVAKSAPSPSSARRGAPFAPSARPSVDEMYEASKKLSAKNEAARQERRKAWQDAWNRFSPEEQDTYLTRMGEEKEAYLERMEKEREAYLRTIEREERRAAARGTRQHTARLNRNLPKLTFANLNQDDAIIKLIGPTRAILLVPAGGRITMSILPGFYFPVYKIGSGINAALGRGDRFTATRTEDIIGIYTSDITITLGISDNYGSTPLSLADFYSY